MYESNNNLPFVPGTALGECDRCGDWKYLNELKLEYSGYRVCYECFETEHPAERIRIPKEVDRVSFRRLPQEIEASACNLQNSVGIAGAGIAGCMVAGASGYYAGIG